MGIGGVFKDNAMDAFKVSFDEATKGEANDKIIYAVLDGNNFVRFVNDELLFKYELSFVSHKSVYAIVDAFGKALENHHIIIKSICFDSIKEPKKYREYKRRWHNRRKNGEEKYNAMLNHRCNDRYHGYPILFIVRWMIMNCLQERFKEANVYYGGTITDLYSLILPFNRRLIARLCNKSGIVISDDNDFLLMPIRGLLPIRQVFSERKNREYNNFKSYINPGFEPVYYSLSSASQESRDAFLLKCYNKGNDYVGSHKATSLDEVRDTDGFKYFMTFYSAHDYPTDESRFLISSMRERKSLHLDEDDLCVLKMPLFVTPDPLSIMVCSLIPRMECICQDYREKSKYFHFSTM